MPRIHESVTGLVVSEDSLGLVTVGLIPGAPGGLATAASVFAVGCLLTDSTTGKQYTNQGTVAAPVWVQNSANLITVAAKSTTTTLTAAEVVGGLITANQAGGAVATYTLPTGTLLQAALPAGFPIGGSFTWRVCNVSTVAAEDVTIAGGTDTTLLGSGAVASNAAATDKSAGTFLFVKSADHAFNVYRVS